MSRESGTGEIERPGVPELSPRARAVQALREWVERGELKPGDRVPAEQSLAASLGIARGTVRQALATLVDEGLLVKLAHRGHQVSRDAGAGSSLMAATCLLLGEYDERHVPVGGYDEAVIAAAAEALTAAGYHRLGLHPSALAPDQAEPLARERPAGCIAFAPACGRPEGRAFIEHLAAAGVPLAVHGEGGWARRFDHCHSDQAAGAADLVRLLLERGRRRPVVTMTTRDRHSWLVDRLRGTDDALAAAGLAPVRRVFLEPPHRGQFEDADEFDRRVRCFAAHLVEQLQGPEPCDAIMVLSDSDVPPVMGALALCGRRPNVDLDVVGYDAYWSSDATWERRFRPEPPLATIDKRNAVIGRSLVALLLDRIAGRVDGGPRQQAVPPRLVVLDPQSA